MWCIAPFILISSLSPQLFFLIYLVNIPILEKGQMQIKKDAVGVSDVILSPDSLSVYYNTFKLFLYMSTLP